MTDPITHILARAVHECPREMAGAELVGVRQDRGREIVVIRGSPTAAARLARFLRPLRAVSAVERLAVVAVLALGIGTASAGPLQRLDGLAQVVDGDTLRVAGVLVRLHGIDAPERGQPWGDESARELRSMAEDRRVACEWREIDRYGRRLAKCWVDGVSLNAEMAERGQAHAFARYSRDYLPHERRARAERRGLWQDGLENDPPWCWRARDRGDRAMPRGCR